MVLFNKTAINDLSGDLSRKLDKPPSFAATGAT
jgi:hypothetical protein